MAKTGQPDEKIITPVAKAITKILEQLFILKLLEDFCQLQPVALRYAG
jgi:hypothetical protein